MAIIGAKHFYDTFVDVLSETCIHTLDACNLILIIRTFRYNRLLDSSLRHHHTHRTLHFPTQLFLLSFLRHRHLRPSGAPSTWYCCYPRVLLRDRYYCALYEPSVVYWPDCEEWDGGYWDFDGECCCGGCLCGCEECGEENFWEMRF